MNDQFISCVPSTIRVEQMRVIRNLIDVKIEDNQLNLANFTDGLEIQVRSEKPFIVNAFWVVKIQDLHNEIGKSWQTMRDELWDEKFLDNSLHRTKPQIHQESNESVKCKIQPPKPIDTSLMTTTPRDFYPLVIIVTCHEEEPNPQATDAAASIHVVHIKDSTVPLKSHVMKQYIKQIDGKILDISQLYVEESRACFICFEEANPQEDLKLFCLLPCRHSPICSECIGRIRECPKCRCAIASVFDINAPAAGYAPPSSTSSIDPSLRYLYDGEDDTRQRRRPGGGFLSNIKSMFGL